MTATSQSIDSTPAISRWWPTCSLPGREGHPFAAAEKTMAGRSLDNHWAGWWKAPQKGTSSALHTYDHAYGWRGRRAWSRGFASSPRPAPTQAAPSPGNGSAVLRRDPALLGPAGAHHRQEAAAALPCAGAARPRRACSQSPSPAVSARRPAPAGFLGDELPSETSTPTTSCWRRRWSTSGPADILLAHLGILVAPDLVGAGRPRATPGAEGRAGLLLPDAAPASGVPRADCRASMKGGQVASLTMKSIAACAHLMGERDTLIHEIAKTHLVMERLAWPGTGASRVEAATDQFAAVQQWLFEAVVQPLVLM